MANIVLTQYDPENDARNLARLYKKYFHHDLNICRAVASVVAKNGDKAVSYGFLIPLLEAVLITDLSAPFADRITAVAELVKYAIEGATDVGRIAVYTENPKFTKTLTNRFGFQLVKANALVLDIVR